MDEEGADPRRLSLGGEQGVLASLELVTPVERASPAPTAARDEDSFLLDDVFKSRRG